MLVNRLEKDVEKELRWNKVDYIPDFPFENFEQLNQKVRNGEYSIGIDFSTSNQFAGWLYGKAYAVFYTVLAATPFVVGILALILAFLIKNYWLLFGIPIGFAGQFLANPYNPLRKFFSTLAYALSFVFIWSLWKGHILTILLTSFFIFPFWINRFIYRYNQNKLMAIALKSEKVFIYLYQNGKLGLMDNLSRQMNWYHNHN